MQREEQPPAIPDASPSEPAHLELSSIRQDSPPTNQEAANSSTSNSQPQGSALPPAPTTVLQFVKLLLDKQESERISAARERQELIQLCQDTVRRQEESHTKERLQWMDILKQLQDTFSKGSNGQDTVRLQEEAHAKERLQWMDMLNQLQATFNKGLNDQ